MIYIVHYDIDYHNFILQPLHERTDVTLIEIPTKISWLMKQLLRIDHQLKLNMAPYVRYRKSDIFKLKFVKNDDKIILFSIIYPMDVLWIFKLAKKHPLNIWTWNIIPYYYTEYIKESTKRGIKFFTFDKGDSIKHSIKLLPQVYRSLNLGSRAIKNDFVFIGKEKGRISTIANLTKQLENLGYSGKIIIVGPEHNSIKLKSLEYSSHLIPYMDVLQIEASSNVIIDIIQEGQSGLTLRIFEALFMRKKIISNNSSLEKYAWYNANNIFIIGKDNYESLSDFMSQKYVDIPLELLSKYDINNWLNNF